MPSSATFRATSGVDPLRLIEGDIAQLFPTRDDLVAAVEWKKSRVLELTARGLDYLGTPFPAYNTTRPVVIYPRHRTHYSDAQKLSAAKRLRRKIGAGDITKGGGLRFESYDAAKKAFGRQHVDLLGLQGPPQMLQTLVVRVISAAADRLDIRLGIYGEEKAIIAQAHNEGEGHMPRRRFLDQSPSDLPEMERIIRDRIDRRSRS